MAAAPDHAEIRMGAIARDPSSVFLYWEFSEVLRADVARELGPRCQWALRVLDLEGADVRTIPVAPEAGNYYLDVEPGRTYAFELAARAGTQWRAVCRTGPLQMPSRQPDWRRGERSSEGPSPGGVEFGLNALRTAARGMGVPGLSYESTALYLGSSPSGSRRD